MKIKIDGLTFTKPTSKDFELASIESVNHKPHPYCITPKHLEGDHMFLDEAAILEAESKGAKCGTYYNPSNPKEYCNYSKRGFVRCELSLKDHTSEKALFIRALVEKQIKDLEGLQEYLLKIKPELEVQGISGVAFVKK